MPSARALIHPKPDLDSRAPTIRPRPQDPDPDPDPSFPPPSPTTTQAAAAAPAYPSTGRAASDGGGSAESPTAGPMYALGAVASASTPYADRDERREDDFRLAPRRLGVG